MKLGLIAGGGELPLAIARRCEAEGRDLHIIRLAGFADPHLERWQLGSLRRGSTRTPT